jgi:surface protein
MIKSTPFPIIYSLKHTLHSCNGTHIPSVIARIPNPIPIPSQAFNENIGVWKVDAVTNMNNMFYGAKAFNQNIGGWTVSAVTTMKSMFAGADAFNQNIGNWEVGAVTTMEGMFSSADVFNQNIGGWNTSGRAVRLYSSPSAVGYRLPSLTLVIGRSVQKLIGGQAI